MIISSISGAMWKILAWIIQSSSTWRRYRAPLSYIYSNVRRVTERLRRRTVRGTWRTSRTRCPPAKRRHGWDAEGAGGTDTPRIQVGDLGGLAETDFPVLDGELTAQKPTPTAGVIKALKADTRQAIASSCKGKKGAKGKSKGGKGKTFHIEQADQMLEALLRQQDPRGTPASGAESGSLGVRESGESMPSGTTPHSASSSGEQEAASGSGQPSASPDVEQQPTPTPASDAGELKPNPTPSPTPLSSGAEAVGGEAEGAGPLAAAGQPSPTAPLNQ